MRKYVIMGIQGSGKGTQSEMLAEDLSLVHISVGDIFRWNVSNHTKMGAQVQRVMAGGELVGDDLVESVVQRRLAEHDWNFGFVIDGFPRNARLLREDWPVIRASLDPRLRRWCERRFALLSAADASRMLG